MTKLQHVGFQGLPVNVGCSNFWYTKKTKATILLRDTNRKNRQVKKTKLLSTVVLKAIVHKEDIEKEWSKFEPCPLDLIQVKDLMIKLDEFKDLKEKLVFCP